LEVALNPTLLEEKGKGWQMLPEKPVESIAENSSVCRGPIHLLAMEMGRRCRAVSIHGQLAEAAARFFVLQLADLR
jgi:hypothetical protein